MLNLAKMIGVIWQKKSQIKRDESEFKLGIPEYLGCLDFSNFKLDKSFTYEFDGHNFRIGYKKNG